MATIHEKLREAAKAGSELELRDLLNDPEGDAWVQDNERMTTLMWAAIYGKEACVGLLLSASDVSEHDEKRWTARRGEVLL